MTAKRARRSASDAIRDDVPYTMRLSDGRTLVVLVPAEHCVRDVSGEIGFNVKGARFLDRIAAVAMRMPKAPTPGFIVTLREALGLTQLQLGERLGVDSMSVSRWERGTVKPSPAAVAALDKLRRAAARRGILVAA